MGLLSSWLGKRDETVDESPEQRVTPDAARTAAGPDASAAPGAGGEASGWDFGSLNAPAEPRPGSPNDFGTPDPLKTLELRPLIIEAISTVFDPEIPVNIFELGLIYDIDVDAEARVRVRMTLTSPACPSAQQLPVDVRYKVKAVPGVTDATVDVVWDPPWSMDKMSDVARLSLGL
jgi:FeS assembly SUF system protein